MDPFVGEIKIVSFNFAPLGWAFCDGQTLSIAQYTALYSLLGKTYGGNGTTTFNLPDFRGRVPIHFNGSYPMGNKSGEETHLLTSAEMPAHIHTVNASSAVANVAAPTGNNWAATVSGYATTPDTTMNSAAINTAGGGQAHENRQPYLVLNFVIALSGVYPSRP